MSSYTSISHPESYLIKPQGKGLDLTLSENRWHVVAPSPTIVDLPPPREDRAIHRPPRLR